VIQGQIVLTQSPLTLTSCRPFQLQEKMLEGKPLATIYELVGLIYGVCQYAQQSAAQLILNTTYEQPLAVPSERLLRLEMIKEHIIAVVQHLAPWLAVDLPMGAAAGIGLWMRAGRDVQPNAVQTLKDQVEHQVSSLLGQHWQQLASVGSFEAAQQCIASMQDVPLLARLQALKSNFLMPSIASTPAQSVYHYPVHELIFEQLLSAKSSLVQQPSWYGVALENAPLGRLAWQEDEGASVHPIWLRILAKLVDLAQLTQAFLSDGMEKEASAIMGCDVRDDLVVSWVETARGRLFHAARCNEAGIALDYAIIAPTEWNFHPQGIVANWLSAWQGSAMDEQAFRSQALNLMQIMDPCVPVVCQELDRRL
jgi:hypothetical protein